ncbi:MAG: hypothetical protein JNJ41_07595 [Bacteroidia bacterium]|nr:hypothetical protein [Bacteroidia bacterium]
MKKFIILIAAAFIFLFNNCKNTSDEEVKKAVVTFFKIPKDFRDVDKNLMSQELSGLIEKAVKREELEVEKIKNSRFPTDKPLCIEGDVFTSLYEGQDSLNILNISAEENKATALIEFTNKQYKHSWKDEVILVNDKGWKIDNVVFKGEDVNSKSTKDLLQSFIDFK